MSHHSRTSIRLLVLLGLALSACAAPTPQTVEVTRVVEGTPQVVVVTPTPGAESVPVAGRPIIPAEGLVECQPLPEIAASAGGGRLAALPGASPAGGRAASQPRDSSSRGSPQQARDTVYRVGVFSDITSPNFWVANGPDNTVWNAYILPPRLTLYALADVSFQFIPILAEDLPGEIVQEGDVWVAEIPIRGDVRWSDGASLTAKDVAFTANTALRFGLLSGNWQQWYDANFLERVEAKDDFTAKYVFHTRPGLARFQYGILQAPILAEYYWAPLVEEAAAPITALGESPESEALAAAQAEAQNALFAIEPDGEPLAGSFLFSKREPGAFVENEANPDYLESGAQIIQYANGAYQEVQADVHDFALYGEPEGDVALEMEAGPFVGAAVYSVYGTQDAAILALQAGEIDFVLNPNGLQRGLLGRVEGDTNLSIVENAANSFGYLSFNNRRRPMNDCAFRQAVAALIDKEFVAGTVLQGVASPVYTFVPVGNAAWYYGDVPKIGQGLDREQRLQLAVAILEQAGYSWEGDRKPAWNADTATVEPGGRLIMPDGAPVPELELWAPNAGYDPLRATFAIWIESWLNEAGIPVKAQLAGFNALIPRIFTEQDFDLYILGWSLAAFPSFLRDFYHSEQAVPDGNNAGGYTSQTFDSLADQLLACDTFESCKEVSDEIQVVLATELPNVVLFETGIVEAYRSASIAFPYTGTLNGLQGAQGFVGGPRGIEVFVHAE